MTLVHPFDATLTAIDPLTRRVTPDDLSDDPFNCLDITMLIIIARPVMALDLTVVGRPGALGLASTVPLPFVFAGAGVHDDGTFELYTIAAEPCRCASGPDNLPHWNPLCLGLVWHLQLPLTIDVIIQTYEANLQLARNEYCPKGMKVIDALM